MLSPFVTAESAAAGAAARVEAFELAPLLVRLRLRFCFPPPILSSVSGFSSSSSLAFLDEDGQLTVCKERKTHQFTRTEWFESQDHILLSQAIRRIVYRTIGRGAKCESKWVREQAQSHFSYSPVECRFSSAFSTRIGRKIYSKLRVSVQLRSLLGLLPRRQRHWTSMTFSFPRPRRRHRLHHRRRRRRHLERVSWL